MTDDVDSHDSKARRMAVRLAEEDVAWLAEQADDEGVEPATLVRMIIARLRRGRLPLISMMEQGAQRPWPPRPRLADYAASAHGPDGGAGQDVVIGDDVDADDVLQQRLAELDGAEVVPLHQVDGEAIATPLLRVGRERYNPGRR